jgi:septal ring factor EnvC (AmiA/AmiB activator)
MKPLLLFSWYFILLHNCSPEIDPPQKNPSSLKSTSTSEKKGADGTSASSALQTSSDQLKALEAELAKLKAIGADETELNELTAKITAQKASIEQLNRELAEKNLQANQQSQELTEKLNDLQKANQELQS